MSLLKKIVVFSSGLLLLGACGAGENAGSSGESGGGKLSVVTTTGQVRDIAAHIGGEQADVQGMMGPGVDPHLYEPTQQDVQNLTEADLNLYNGLNLEGNMGEVFQNVESETPSFAVAENVPEDMLISGGEDYPHDPHVWFDPDRWAYAVKAVRDAFIEVDPANEEAYKERAQEYLDMLDEMDTYAEEQIHKIPEESRVIVTAHDAFSYFGDAYGMEVKGLQGISTDAEFGVGDVNNIVDLMVERSIGALFVESSVSEQAVNSVVEGAKEQGQQVEIGGELYSDAMGEAGTEEGTYEGMFRHNIDTIVSSLQ
ncbi:metal ABC transporter solute-binding protein, Zn/Mn family [Salibacterium halotolerans]|uniref:Manganese/zinc/iron transport system substrate-binding protein n=1 Tax=Salibacterium halotolerans TaxID=1884432 RepID=A0A1I5V3T4_9BACI|nr:zinc ABC transporter substrate-binding protein [Salibacterium halotolerans]SFQ02148.1 manganese/zinc/iron transport system substrate-binding protein [Salibacterium halotolerans]